MWPAATRRVHAQIQSVDGLQRRRRYHDVLGGDVNVPEMALQVRGLVDRRTAGQVVHRVDRFDGPQHVCGANS